MMSVADEIAKLNALQQSGAITEEEYEKLKTALLEKQLSGPPDPVPVSMPAFDVNNWAMFIHLSQFFGPIVPIVLWQVKKDEDPVIDLHGKIVANWMITVAILSIAIALLYLLSFFFLKIPFLLLIIGPLLTIPLIAFPIIGGMKANKGEVWPYPLSIRFFSLKK